MHAPVRYPKCNEIPAHAPGYNNTWIHPVRLEVDASCVRVPGDVWPGAIDVIVEDIGGHTVALRGYVVAAANACEPKVVDVVVVDVHAYCPLVEDNAVAGAWVEGGRK